MQINQTNSFNANVNNIPANQNQNSSTPLQTTPAPGNNNADAFAIQDVYEPSGQVPAPVAPTPAPASANANRYNADISRMREIWSEHDRNVDSFRRLVETLLNQQVERAGGDWNFNDPDAMVEIDEAARTAAQESIGEGGPFSVEAVATRLLDFAVAVSGGDPSRIDVLRRAVEQGFEAAERQWGGNLPDISQRTREAVMNGFDQWQQEGSASAIELLNRATSPAAPGQ